MFASGMNDMQQPCMLALELLQLVFYKLKVTPSPFSLVLYVDVRSYA